MKDNDESNMGTWYTLLGCERGDNRGTAGAGNGTAGGVK